MLQVFIIDHSTSTRRRVTRASLTFNEVNWLWLTLKSSGILFSPSSPFFFFFCLCGFTFSFCGFGNQSATSQVSGLRAFPTSRSVRGEITWTRDGNSRAVMQGGEGSGGEGRGGSGVRTAVCVRHCANVGIMLSSSHCRTVGGESIWWCSWRIRQCVDHTLITQVCASSRRNL